VVIRVLDNDFGGAADQDTLTIFLSPPFGQAQVVGHNVQYRPDPGFTGIDGFVHRVCSTARVCGLGVVLVTVTA
jgi:hypothetical protein